MFRLLILGLCITGLFLSGCRNESETLKKGASDTVKQIDRSKALSDLTQVTGVLHSYYAEHQSYPSSIKELKLNLYYPNDLDYEPATGKIRSKTYPDL